MPVLEQLATVVVDCADPVALAAFYQAATGWQLTYSDKDFASLSAESAESAAESSDSAVTSDSTDGARPGLAFVRVEGYRTPRWPEGGKHLHLDFTVSDLDRAVAELLGLGASRPAFQPGEGQWVVLTDPEGHPFCLIPAATPAV